MIYYLKKFEDVLKPILESLNTQFKKKGESFSISYFSTSINEEIKVCIVDKSFFNPFKNKDINKKLYKYILFVEEKLDTEIFDFILDNEIVGIFSLNKLQYEFEERGKLEKTLKELIRNNKISKKGFGNKYYEKEYLFKEINWKFDTNLKNEKELFEFYSKKKYVSIFLDSSMKNFYLRLNNIINEFEQSKIKINSKLNNISKLPTKNKIENLLEVFNEEHLTLPSLLIEGETGTGKTLIANILSQKIFNKNIYKFSMVNIEKTLIDSELFGSRKGAYTGASDREGRLMSNIGNFVFLDEIAEVPTNIQTKLLLYLDDFKVTPEGYDGEPIPVPTFIIGATNKDLKTLISKGEFREDLYHRFKYKIRIPSLRERKEDLRFLISFIMQNPFINPFKNKTYAVNKIALEAIEKLESYIYPGNFRELEYIIKTAISNAIYSNLDIVLPEHIINISL